MGGRTFKSLAVSGNQTGREKSKSKDQIGRSQEGLDRGIQRHSGKEYTALKYTEKQDPGDDTGLTTLNSRHTQILTSKSVTFKCSQSEIIVLFMTWLWGVTWWRSVRTASFLQEDAANHLCTCTRAKVQHYLQKAAMKSSSSLTRPPLAHSGI